MVSIYLLRILWEIYRSHVTSLVFEHDAAFASLFDGKNIFCRDMVRKKKLTRVYTKGSKLNYCLFLFIAQKNVYLSHIRPRLHEQMKTHASTRETKAIMKVGSKKKY